MIDLYPKISSYDDLWRQIKRTVKGVPVSQEQINMIVQVVGRELELRSDDVLLDLGCGNGALSKYFFEEVSGFLGVDISEDFISTALEHFEKKPSYVFERNNIVSYLTSELLKSRFTKCLCYGVFAYLSYDDARATLDMLFKKFSNVEIVFIGNLPDADKAESFYYKDIDIPSVLHDNNSAIGIWRTRDEFSQLATETGWKIKFNVMPKDFYASHYRYDVTLKRHE